MFGKKPKSQPLPSISLDQSPGTAADSSVNSLRGPDPVPAEQTAPSQQANPRTEESHVMESDLTASVSRNTVFTGNISSEDNVEIFGKVEGSVTSTAVVKIHGRVNGDVTCGVLVASNAEIIGNIACEKSAVFGNETNVNGNITATVVTVSGQINGNINASESVSVSSTGAIYGDIATPEIEVSKGAIVFGSVVMEQPPEPEPQEEEAPPEPEKKEAPAQPEQKPAPAESPAEPEAEDDESLGPWTAEHKHDGKDARSPFSLEGK